MKLFVKDLTVIDSSYLSDEHGLTADSWIVDMELSGDLNEMSMILDFGKIKKRIKSLVDSTVDHTLIVPADSPNLTRIDSTNTYIDFCYPAGSIHLSCPESSFCFLPTKKISNTAIKEYIEKIALDALPNNVAEIAIHLRHEAIHSPFYHYTHGLKKHDGNCQRIAHGHRSKIEIYRGDYRDTQLEAKWAKHWQHAYLATAEDQIEPSQADLSEAALKQLGDHYTFAYQAPQGEFTLAVPKKPTHILPCDTTIECLVDWIKQTLISEEQDESITVIAYEGIGKGAMA